MPKFYISSKFGVIEAIRGNQPHTGVDIPLEVGTKLRSFIDGTVERILEGGKIGKGVIIRGEDGNAYIYGHLSKVTVKEGQTIDAARDIIGLSGNTGNSTGPHLHFAIQKPDGAFIDPEPAIKALEAVTGADPLGQYLGSQPLPGTVMDWINGVGDSIWAKEKEIIEDVSNPVWAFVKGQLIDLGQWIVNNIPEIMGYGAVLAGICIILGSMAGKGMMKPLAIYAGMLIIAVLLRGGGQ
jgi:hypothetical protein